MLVLINSRLFGGVTHPAASEFEPSSSAFAKLSALILDENKLPFSTAIDLAIDIEMTVENCLESETGCYMLVTCVAEDMVEPIREAMEELGIRKGARFTYEQTVESLIIRLMPGALPENVSWSFCLKIHNKVANIPGHSEYSVCDVGASTFHFPGGRVKEGDGGFKPLDTRGEDGEWPSLMVEVGCSGSLPALRCDAEMWLWNSGGRTRMVIIIEIAKNPNSLRLECWTTIVNPNRRVTSNTRLWTLDFGQHFDIDRDGTVSPAGLDLVIPYHTLFDTYQHGAPDIIISARELSEWALVMYRLFNRSQPQVQDELLGGEIES